jgi:hypothetical protein
MLMRMMFLLTAVGLFSGAAFLPQSVGSGLRVVVKVEVRRPAGGPLPFAERVFERMLPDGTAEVEFVTDGSSVRRVQRGRVRDDPDGTITIVRAGEATRLVLNPAARTYYRTNPGSDEPAGPEPTLRRSGSSETIAGFKGEKILVSWSEPTGNPPPAGMAPAVTTEIEAWCTSAVRVPASLRDMLNPVRGRGSKAFVEQFAKACPLPLRYEIRLSISPGYAVVSTVTSVASASPPPGLFEVPAGYREVPRPDDRKD